MEEDYGYKSISKNCFVVRNLNCPFKKHDSSWSVKLLKLGLSGQGMGKEFGSRRSEGLILLVLLSNEGILDSRKGITNLHWLRLGNERVEVDF